MNIFPYIRQYPRASFVIIAIWIVCMIPVPETPLNSISFIDKWTHFVMYGSLTLVIWYEYLRNHNFFRSVDWLIKHKANIIDIQWSHLMIGGVLLPIAQGGLIELAQAYLTTCRSGDWFDFLCNSLGVLLGTGMGYSLIAISKKK